MWAGDVARWLRALGAPPTDQDDLLQEVFIVVHRRLVDFDGENMASWLYRIAAHKVRDFRRLTWIRHIFGRSEPTSASIPATDPTPAGLLELRQRQQWLEELLASLPLAQRATLVLFEVDGYTSVEIARLQGVSVNTVRARIHRARKGLARLLSRRPDMTELLAPRRNRIGRTNLNVG